MMGAQVSTYEVLVPAFQPIRYCISDSLPTVKESPKNRTLERLKSVSLMHPDVVYTVFIFIVHSRLKTVILVDDSPSVSAVYFLLD